MEEILKISLIAYMFCALGYEENMIFTWYQKLIRKFPKWLSFPLGECYKCFVGQACFWFYFLNRIALGQYDFFEHLFFTSAGIFASVIYNKIWDICESGQ